MADESPAATQAHICIWAGLILAFTALWRRWFPGPAQSAHPARFQPLAPRYANEEDEFVPTGFNRWVKTWMADYASVEEIYWPVPGDADGYRRSFRLVPLIPRAARSKPSSCWPITTRRCTSLPELDARFAALAAERIRARAFALLRVAADWCASPTCGCVRVRRLLPSDTRWWEFNDDPTWSALAVTMGMINLLYLGAGVAGLLRARWTVPLGLVLTFVLLRSAFLGSLENPEPRYTLEAYFFVIVMSSVLFK